ncbi:MAG: bifunctional diguanylate cyclase/phosphodiesterase [Geminicoccaceae bacterium]
MTRPALPTAGDARVSREQAAPLLRSRILFGPALAAVLAVAMLLLGATVLDDAALLGVTAMALGVAGLVAASVLALHLARGIDNGAGVADATAPASPAPVDPPDPLTGLLDAGAFKRRAEDMLALALRQGGRLGVVLVDIDGFNDINGYHGYRVGDLVLRQVARRLTPTAAEPALLARLGGDRFALLTAAVADEPAGESCGAGIVEQLGRLLVVDSVELELSVSVGIAIFPDGGPTLEPVLRCAEMALGEAKRAGGGRARVFSKRTDQVLKARRSFERDLRIAIENGDFQLHYQPQIDLRSGQVVGVEGLLRWPHRERGMIPPASFIPVAEATGLIRPLGAWVLGEACRAGRRLHDRGLPLSIAVNLSAAQLRQQDLLNLVGKSLSESGLPAGSLELELTESLFVDPSEILLRRALERIAEMGVQLAIDDFGTGYSSLAYLKRLPVSKIKIDRSFLADIGQERTDEAIVRTIIGLARTFGKQVLAEGVETEAQRQFLIREGCDSAQGYLFSRPVAEPALTAQLLGEAIPATSGVIRLARAG